MTWKVASRKTVQFLLYLSGILIIIALIHHVRFNDIVAAMQVVGPGAVWLVLVPITWVIPDAITLRILLGNKVKFLKVLYAQISGDAFNSITPLIGVGGEPYKAKFLSNFVPLEDASHAVVLSRLINALSGVIFTAIVLVVSLCIIDLSGMVEFAFGLAVVAIVMFIMTGLLLFMIMSHAPSRIVVYLLARFRLVENAGLYHITWTTLWSTMAWKMVGRGGKFLELYLIFLALDISPSFADVVLVEAMVMASVSLFFFVPQGLGVNEAGIVTAFSILGYTAAGGVAYGLLRRARMLTYALFGLMVYLVANLNDIRRSRLYVNSH